MYPYCLCKHWKWLGAVLLCSRWCGYFLQLRCFVGQLLALLPQQPTFDESFKLMLLRLHGFNFAISLACGPSSSFFFWIPCELIQWRPKMASRFIRKPFPLPEVKQGHYSAAITTAADGVVARRVLCTSKRQGVQWLTDAAVLIARSQLMGFVAVSSQRGPSKLGGCHQGDQPHLSGN